MSLEFVDEEDFETKKKLNPHTLRRILSQLKPHRRQVAGFIAVILVVSFLDAFFTFLSKQILDVGILGRNIAALQNILLEYFLLTLVQALGVFGFIYLVSLLGEQVRYDLRRSMFNHLQDLSLSYYSRTPVGWIMSRVTSDSDRVAELITWGLLDSTWAATNIIGSMAFMLIINWKLALLVFLSLPVLFVIANGFQKRILVQFRQVRRLNSKITGTYNENINGVRVVKALGREQENLREFNILSGEMYRASYRAAWLSALFLPTVQLISASVLGVILWFSGTQAGSGGMSIGGIQAFVTYVTFMMWPIQDLARVFAELQHAIASAERIYSLIDATPEIVDGPSTISPSSIQGDIEFKDVTFFYDNDPPVLKNFSLQVRRGETIALVGPTGGGKSTIVNLVGRFYEPKSGSIFIGGRDYKNISLHALQSRIGMVLQTPHLFSGTIRENVRYGRLDATDQEIENACELAGAHGFIVKLPKGYEEPVGEGGNLLSVGQKQLISLARAVLAKPEIFIMDEATSSVDTLTEALIQKGMEELMNGRTSFIIAHRLSTIKRADRIIVIEDGQIAEVGTHADLLRKKGKYYALYTRQFRHQMERSLDPFEAGAAA